MPALPGRAKHKITVKQAQAHTRRHRNIHLPHDPRHHPIASHGGCFEAKQVRALLDQGCTHLAVYHGISEEGRPTVILVGRDATAKDMVGPRSMVLEEWFPCPPYCDASSPLNS